MQRWTFLEKTTESVTAVEDEINSLESEAVERVHIFRVKVLGALKETEVVAVIGDSPGLGDWNLDSCVLLQPPGMGEVEYWHAEVTLPNLTLVRYRYFICTVDNNEAMQAIHTLTEIFTLEKGLEENKIDHFERTRCERGWLLYDSAVQFQIDVTSIELDKPPKNRIMRLHCSTIPIDESRGLEAPSVEVVEAGKFVQQQQFGVLIDPQGHLLFEMRMPKPQEMVYLLNFYTFRSEASQPCHYGYAWILPETIAGVEGFIKSSIFCATKHQVLGRLMVEFIHAKPVPRQVSGFT
jgi:Starch binding domain